MTYLRIFASAFILTAGALSLALLLGFRPYAPAPEAAEEGKTCSYADGATVYVASASDPCPAKSN